MKLYTYWRSTAAYRVRIALALKNLDVEHVPVHLVRNGGEQNAAWYRRLDPQGRVPALLLDDGTVIAQSTAIIEYLEETYASPALLGSNPQLRARARAIANIIACDIHPLGNVSPLNHLRALGHDEDAIRQWIARWTREGLAAVESLIEESEFCFGPEPGLADLYLVPQAYSAARYCIEIEAFPKICRVLAHAKAHPAFIKAHPSNQADAEA